MRNGLQDYMDSNRSQPGYPFEAAYEQPLQQEETYSQVQQQQQQQYVPQSYRGAEYSMPISQAQAQAAGAGAAGLPSYGEQAQQGIESYQQEQQQIQQIMQQQQQQQQQLLLDLYKTPLGQGRAHQDVYRQQQNVSDRGYGFSPMSMYTNGVPTSAYGGFGNSTPLNYSPSSNVSSVSYSNGKLSYNY